MQHARFGPGFGEDKLSTLFEGEKLRISRKNTQSIDTQKKNFAIQTNLLNLQIVSHPNFTTVIVS